MCKKIKQTEFELLVDKFSFNEAGSVFLFFPYKEEVVKETMGERDKKREMRKERGKNTFTVTDRPRPGSASGRRWRQYSGCVWYDPPDARESKPGYWFLYGAWGERENPMFRSSLGNLPKPPLSVITSFSKKAETGRWRPEEVPGLLCLPLLSSHQNTWNDPGKWLRRDRNTWVSCVWHFFFFFFHTPFIIKAWIRSSRK